jgi:hypothetical protein
VNTLLIRAVLLVLLVALTLTTVGGQPPDAKKEPLPPQPIDPGGLPAPVPGGSGPPLTGAPQKIAPPPGAKEERPPFTAFPDLKPRREFKEVKNPGGPPKVVLQENPVVPLPPWPVVAADAPVLRKVQFERLQEGLHYIKQIEEVISTGSWTAQFFLDYLFMVAEVYRVAAELEETPAKRVPWYEARVREFKEVEGFTYRRVSNGTDPPQRLDQAQFLRFRAEAELLVLKAEVEKVRQNKPVDLPNKLLPAIKPMEPPNKPPVDTKPVEQPRDDTPLEQRFEPELRKLGFRPSFTAFPDLQPPTVERKEVKNPGGPPKVVIEEKGVVPLPPLPVVAADAPVLRKVQFEQLHAGLDYIKQIAEVMRIGSWTAQYFLDYLSMIAEVCRVAAELEETPAKRVPWYEARVRKFKEAERFTAIRVANGRDPAQRLNQVRFARLGAEAELLVLKAEVEKAPKNKPIDPPNKLPPDIKRPEPPNKPPVGTKPAEQPRDDMPLEQRFEPELRKLGFRPSFTAFPDLQPLTVERKEVKNPGGPPKVVPRPPLPIVAADAPVLRKVQFEQLHAGLNYLNRVQEVISTGSWTAQFFLDYLFMVAEVYRVAAELEETPAKRVPWYEARVRECKEAERFTIIRVFNRTDPPQRLNQIRFARLKAEAELLVLKAEVEKARQNKPVDLPNKLPPDMKCDRR